MKKKKALIAAIAIAACIGGTSFAIIRYNENKERPTAPQQTQHNDEGTRTHDMHGERQQSANIEKPDTSKQSEPNLTADAPVVSTDTTRQSHTEPSRIAHHGAPVARIGTIQQHASKPSTSGNSSQHTTVPHSPAQPNTPAQPPAAPTPPATPPTQPTPPAQPPAVPPTQPPVTPTPPPKPPKPPKPPVTPPQQNLTDEEKARKIINDLKSPANQNVAQFTNDDGQIRTVLWTKGITSPRLGAGGDFVKHDETSGGTRYVTYSAAYRPEFARHGWYDADKAHGSSPVDINLCFGSVAANQLHWWMHNNRDYVTRFLAKTNYAAQLPPAQHGTLKDLRTFQDSFVDQQDSRFFSMMKVYFGNNREGYYADPLIDMFINGHKPKPGGGYNDPDNPHSFRMDSRGGFFHDVFEKRNLTRRMTMGNFKDFATEMKKAFQAGESVGVIHHTSAQNTHIVTAWGLEYDLDGTLVAIYVTDSDDQDSPHNGMKRYGVRNINNNAYLSNNLSNPNSGAKVDQISTLGLGEDKWKEYLK